MEKSGHISQNMSMGELRQIPTECCCMIHYVKTSTVWKRIFRVIVATSVLMVAAASLEQVIDTCELTGADSLS